MISQPALAELRAALRGKVLAPGEPGYDAARQIFNAMIDCRPAVIARCATAGDVVAYTRLSLQQMHGAAARVPPTATAFVHRHDQWEVQILSQWLDAADDEPNIRWARECHAALAPHLERAVYVNSLGDDESDRVGDAYGSNYDGLAAIKAVYDPANFFRSNQNVATAPR